MFPNPRSRVAVQCVLPNAEKLTGLDSKSWLNSFAVSRKWSKNERLNLVEYNKRFPSVL